MSEAWPKRKRDAVGRYVRLRRKITTNGGTIFKVGEVMLIERSYAGLHLRAITQCPTCEREFSHFVRGVSEGSVELLPQGFKP